MCHNNYRLIINQNKQTNVANAFTDECGNKCEQEIRLEPDKSISGALAFRLTGGKTRGVFIQHVNQKSKQSKMLYKGDQILRVNGVDVRRLTCDQIVNALRVAVYNNGYALLQVSRKIRSMEDELDDTGKDDNGNLRYYDPVKSDLATNNNNSTLPVSLSDITGLSEAAVYARAVMSSSHRCNDLIEMECTQLVCFNEKNEKQFSLCAQRRKFSAFGYLKQLIDNDNGSECEEKCAECSKCSTKWRWHAVKHRCAKNAMKLLPKSASELFGIHIYQKVYYHLI